MWLKIHQKWCKINPAGSCFTAFENVQFLKWPRNSITLDLFDFHLGFIGYDLGKTSSFEIMRGLQSHNHIGYDDEIKARMFKCNK